MPLTQQAAARCLALLPGGQRVQETLHSERLGKSFILKTLPHFSSERCGKVLSTRSLRLWMGLRVGLESTVTLWVWM